MGRGKTRNNWVEQGRTKWKKGRTRKKKKKVEIGGKI